MLPARPTGGPFGIVLAGGRSSRMGQDKARLTLGGETMLARSVRRLGAQCQAVVISGNGPASYEDLPDVPVLPDAEPGWAGPLGGIMAGLHWAATLPGGATGLVSVPVDTPFAPRDLAARFRDAVGDGGAAVAVSAGRLHPVVAWWPLRARARVSELLRAGETRLWAVLEDIGAVRVDWPTEPYDPFSNLNRPEDVTAAERILATWPDA